MKKSLAALLAVLLIFGCAALTACSKKRLSTEAGDSQIISADEIADTMTSKDGKYEIAMVTNVGRLKDKSFNQGTWDGVKLFAYKNGKSYKYYQPRNGNKASDDDRYNAFIEAIKGGANIIVATGYEQENALKRAATENPDTKFIFVDGYVLTNGDGQALSRMSRQSHLKRSSAAILRDTPQLPRAIQSSALSAAERAITRPSTDSATASSRVRTTRQNLPALSSR